METLTENVNQWFEKRGFADIFHAYQINAITFIMAAVIETSTLIPAQFGRNAKSDTSPKHQIKRVFRTIDNERIDREKQLAVAKLTLARMLRDKKHLLLIGDWTTHAGKFNLFEISIATKKGRSIPLFRDGYELKKLDEANENASQNIIEENAIKDLLDGLSENDLRKITMVFDRGFCRAAFIEFLKLRKIKFVVRVKGDHHVTIDGSKMNIEALGLQLNSEQDFGEVEYSSGRRVAVRLVGTWQQKMKEPWYLITNCEEKEISEIVRIYGLRWETESLFKTKKDPLTGLSVGLSRLQSISRWIRLSFLASIVFLFLAEIGLEAMKDNTLVYRYTTASWRKRRIFSFYSVALNILRELGRFVKLLWDGPRVEAVRI